MSSSASASRLSPASSLEIRSCQGNLLARGCDLIVRRIGKTHPVSTPLESGDFAGIGGVAVWRVVGEVLAAIEQANIPGKAEIMPALAAPCFGDSRTGIPKTSLPEECILLGIAAGSGNDFGVVTVCLDRRERPSGQYLGINLQSTDIAFTPGIEATLSIGNVFATLVKRLFGLARELAILSIQSLGLKTAAGKQSLKEEDIIPEESSAHDRPPTILFYSRKSNGGRPLSRVQIKLVSESDDLCKAGLSISCPLPKSRNPGTGGAR